MPKLQRGLETKPVFDWNDEPLGTVLGSEQDPDTHDPMSLIVGLSADAQEDLGTEKDTVALPFDMVFGIRRDEVRLERGVQEIAETLSTSEPRRAGSEEGTTPELTA